MMARAGLLVACVLALPWPVAAQGLGDAAAREKERRTKEAQAGGKKAEPTSYTNDDLPGSKEPSKKEEGKEAAPAARPSRERPAEESSPGPLAERAAAEREYEGKVDAAQKEMDALDARVRDLQAKLNPMSTTYIYGATGAVAEDELRVRNELRDTEARLAAARQALETAKNELSEFRLGRRSPPPPDLRRPEG